MFNKVFSSSNLPLALVLLAFVAMGGGVLILREQPGTPAEVPVASTAKNPGRPAPDFDVVSVGGGRIRLSDYRGKVVIVDFWSITCGPCLDANEHLQRFYSDYKKLGLEIIGLSIDQYSEQVEDFIESYPVSYHIGMATEKVIRDYGGVFSIPQTYVLDREGRIVNKYEGYSELSAYQMERLIKKLLASG